MCSIQLSTFLLINISPINCLKLQFWKNLSWLRNKCSIVLKCTIVVLIGSIRHSKVQHRDASRLKKKIILLTMTGFFFVNNRYLKVWRQKAKIETNIIQIRLSVLRNLPQSERTREIEVIVSDLKRPKFETAICYWDNFMVHDILNWRYVGS